MRSFLYKGAIMPKYKIALLAFAAFLIGDTLAVQRANKIIAKNSVKYDEKLNNAKFDSFRAGADFATKTERENAEYSANRPECGE